MSRSIIDLLGATAFAVSVIGFANAPAEAAQPYDWTGFYLGANVGGLGLSTDFDVNLPAPLHSFSSSSTGTGIVGGVFGGYQYQFKKTPIVIGLEADFQGADASTSFDRQEAFGEIGSCNVNGGAALDWQSSVRGRVGYALGRFQPYVTGGFQFGQFDFDNGLSCQVREEAPLVGSVSASEDKILTGWTVGVGLDYAATNSIMIQVEYRHEDFGDETLGFGGGVPGSVSYDPSADMITVGAAWHF